MTMKNNPFIKKRLPLFVLFLAFALFMLSMVGNSSENETGGVAEKTAARLQKRLAKLDAYACRALVSHDDRCLDGLPDDMVVYKYENDSIRYWSNQFPIKNDDISTVISSSDPLNAVTFSGLML